MNLEERAREVMKGFLQTHWLAGDVRLEQLKAFAQEAHASGVRDGLRQLRYRLVSCCGFAVDGPAIKEIDEALARAAAPASEENRPEGFPRDRTHAQAGMDVTQQATPPATPDRAALVERARAWEPFRVSRKFDVAEWITQAAADFALTLLRERAPEAGDARVTLQRVQTLIDHEVTTAHHEIRQVPADSTAEAYWRGRIECAMHFDKSFGLQALAMEACQRSDETAALRAEVEAPAMKCKHGNDPQSCPFMHGGSLDPMPYEAPAPDWAESLWREMTRIRAKHLTHGGVDAVACGDEQVAMLRARLGPCVEALRKAVFEGLTTANSYAEDHLVPSSLLRDALKVGRAALAALAERGDTEVGQ